jgi:hypothetical protein
MEDPMETLRELWEICGREMRKRGEKIQENLTRRDIYYERLRGNPKDIQEDQEWEIQGRYMEIHGSYRDICNENFRRNTARYTEM